MKLNTYKYMKYIVAYIVFINNSIIGFTIIIYSVTN